jgi:hypothetical protein
MCHLPDFITFFFIVEYVGLIKHSMNCELYTLQIIIYNLHKELNFNVHTVFSLSANDDNLFCVIVMCYAKN